MASQLGQWPIGVVAECLGIADSENVKAIRIYVNHDPSLQIAVSIDRNKPIPAACDNGFCPISNVPRIVNTAGNAVDATEFANRILEFMGVAHLKNVCSMAIVFVGDDLPRIEIEAKVPEDRLDRLIETLAEYRVK